MEIGGVTGERGMAARVYEGGKGGGVGGEGTEGGGVKVRKGQVRKGGGGGERGGRPGENNVNSPKGGGTHPP